MIHLIYIYFIINAFFSADGDSYKMKTLIFLFGLPYYTARAIIAICVALFWKLNSKTFVGSILILWFTDKYNRNDLNMDLAKERYEKGNWFEKQFIRALDKKYNYGITKNETNR